MGRAVLDISDFPMLSVCEYPGCSTILLGHGRCLAHDRSSEAGLGRGAVHGDENRLEVRRGVTQLAAYSGAT